MTRPWRFGIGIAVAMLIAIPATASEPSSTGPPADGVQVEVDALANGSIDFPVEFALTKSDTPELPLRFAVPAPTPFEPGYREPRRIARRTTPTNRRTNFLMHNTLVTANGKIARISTA